MELRHGCFISYAQGKYGLMQHFKDDLVDALRCYLEPYFDRENELFIDTEQFGGGDAIDYCVARALCQSVCMIVIYTPKYEAHAYTRREFAAMQLIEAERRRWYDLPSRLIIPIIQTQSSRGLPEQIRGPGFYLDFSRYSLATGELKTHPEFLPHIEKLAARIGALYECQKMVVSGAGNCNQIGLPAVPPPWRDHDEIILPPK